MARAKPIMCPACGAADVRRTDATWRCNHCDSHFVFDHGTTRITSQGEIPPATNPDTRRAIAGGTLVLVLAALGVAAGFALRSPAEPAVMLPEPVAAVREAATASAPKAPEPTIELAHEVQGRTSIGGVFWLATYRNTGKVPIERPALVATMFQDGKRVGEQKGYSRLQYLSPGEETVVLALSSEPPEFERAELFAVRPQAARSRKGEVPLGVRDLVTRPAGQLTTVTGTVTNIQDAPVKVMDVVVVGRGEDGRPVAYATGSTSMRDLVPGATTGFELKVGTFQVEEPARYTAFAVGRLQ